MEQLRNFGDERQMAVCVYCGRRTETRDHVPSKVFLDNPYPANLPVVPACQLCNLGFSLDEEYVACLVECTLTGSTGLNRIKRNKIRRILERKPALMSRIFKAHRKDPEGTSFNVEMDRVRNVVLKLARGHAAFELNEPLLDDPSSLTFAPFFFTAPDVREHFKAPPRPSIWPEVGSRAMQRLVLNDTLTSKWITVQPARYSYLTSTGDKIIVRMIISEYLVCEVVWYNM